ncbi:esterase-like activity of phytase family protein [Aquicoccus porphyridii]|uniref:Esterase-like activity of phytase family protein n=2 Tax=Aquicoccus porphyridii TaxID=1852029 RepID=A0A5A9ZKP0_9RHOB|nr:esterase-like activity of phytase family protein [Aquicoccus porphyridii]RAI55694.1 esterase-like activity of phytase family protein [Rhodobacteraceae bacterium AsT-22]
MRWRSTIAIGAILPVILTLTGSAGEPFPETYMARYTWQESTSEFGGFSGLDIAANGRDFVAVTDRGFLARGVLMRDDEQIIGVKLDHFAAIEPSQTTEKLDNDAEAVAIGADGIYISYEQDHRVIHLVGTGPALRSPTHPDFRLFPRNGGIEALAVDEKGLLHALPERFRRGGAFPVYRLDGSEWSVITTLDPVGGFEPAGASFGPDGALYVLERAFTGYGFRSRVRRVIETDQGWRDDEVFRSPTGRHDNLEGIAAWRDEDGHIRLTMISDDNFFFFQRTEFVEYTVPPELAIRHRTP